MNAADRERLLRARERAEQERQRFHDTLAEMKQRYSLADWSVDSHSPALNAARLYGALLDAAADHIASLEAEIERLREGLRQITAVVDHQAEDEALWAVYPDGVQPISEAYLQQELRHLHAVAERQARALLSESEP